MRSAALAMFTGRDSAVFTRTLLGDPACEEPVEDGCGAWRGERWQYEIDGRDGHADDRGRQGRRH